jgi:pimeloyl-ACP methyl ester carboxylesterase
MPKGGNAAKGTSFRWDRFPSRAVAEAGMRKNPFFKNFDPRVLNAYFKHALIDKPDGSAELATPKAQEAWSYLRANFQPLPENESEEVWNSERLLNPDYTPFSDITKAVFTRPEGLPVIDSLPNLRPRTLFIYGEKSHIGYDQNREVHLSTTGVGRGGSGGVVHNAVHSKIYDGLGHLCCFEAPTAIATDVAYWLDKEVVRWRDEQKFYKMYNPGHSKEGEKELSDQWLQAVKKKSDLERPKKSGSKL